MIKDIVKNKLQPLSPDTRKGFVKIQSASLQYLQTALFNELCQHLLILFAK